MDVLAFFMDCAKPSRLSTGVDCDNAASVTELCLLLDSILLIQDLWWW
jgi:hypothetical protein